MIHSSALFLHFPLTLPLSDMSLCWAAGTEIPLRGQDLESWARASKHFCMSFHPWRPATRPTTSTWVWSRPVITGTAQRPWSLRWRRVNHIDLPKPAGGLGGRAVLCIKTVCENVVCTRLLIVGFYQFYDEFLVQTNDIKVHYRKCCIYSVFNARST